MSETLQWVIVGVVVGTAVVVAIRRAFCSKRGECDGCQLKDNCTKKYKSKK